MLRTVVQMAGQGVCGGVPRARVAFAFENLGAENYLISAQRNGFVLWDGVVGPRGLASVRDCHQAGSAFLLRRAR